MEMYSGSCSLIGMVGVIGLEIKERAVLIILGLYDSTSKRESGLLHQNGRNMFDYPLMLFLVFVLSFRLLFV